MMTENELTQEQRTNREISNANLVPIKRGEVLNPGGRPKGKSITAELRKLIDSGTNAEDAAKILYEMAKTKQGRDQLAALKELLDRTDGKVMDVHRLEGDVPVTLIFKLKEKDAIQSQGDSTEVLERQEEGAEDVQP